MINLPLIQHYKFCKPGLKQCDKSGLKLATPLNKDTVSFGQNRDFMERPKKEIFAAISKAIKEQKNFLGGGYEALCYKIPNTGYCVRLIRENIDDYRKEFTKEISKAEQLNHVVAKLGGGSQIQKYIEGYPVEFPIEVNFDKTPEDVAKIIDEIPVSSYSDMLRQICNAVKEDMMFDCVGFNVIVDPEKKSITAIDFYQNDMSEPDILRPLSDLYVSLKNSKTTIEQKRRIAGKILLAALAEYEPHHRPCLRLQEFDFSSFLNKNKQDGLIADDKFSKLLVDKLEELNNLKNNNTRRNNKETEKQLIGELKILRALVNQMYLK